MKKWPDSNPRNPYIWPKPGKSSARSGDVWCPKDARWLLELEGQVAPRAAESPPPLSSSVLSSSSLSSSSSSLSHPHPHPLKYELSMLWIDWSATNPSIVGCFCWTNPTYGVPNRGGSGKLTSHPMERAQSFSDRTKIYGGSQAIQYL